MAPSASALPEFSAGFSTAIASDSEADLIVECTRSRDHPVASDPTYYWKADLVDHIS